MKAALPFGVSSPEAKRETYRSALRAVGIEPVENVATLDGVDGLCLAGGADVNPALYAEAPRPETEEPDLERDRLEGLCCSTRWTAICRFWPSAAACNC